MDNAAFSRLLTTNDKSLIQELTKRPEKKKNNRPHPKGGKAGAKGGKSRGGDDSDDDGPRGKGKAQGKGKGKAPKGGEEQKKEEHRDRAKERRDGHFEYAHVAAEFENQSEVTLEDSKYLGGDMEHTHLVKGLDFSLLAKVRGELNKQQRAEQIQEERQQKKNKKRTFETVLAKSVWHAVVDTVHPHHVDFGKRMHNMGKAISLGQRIRGSPTVFLPGRMAFEFDTTMEQGPQDIPKIIYMAKEDAPSVDHSKKVAATLPETVVKVRDAFEKAVEERKKRKLAMAEKKSASASYVVAEKVSAPKHKAKDLDDDIFGDAGSYAETKKEMERAAARKAAKKAKVAGIKPEGSEYFNDAGDEKYKKAPEGQLNPDDMIVEEKEGEVVGTAEDDAKPYFEAAERFQGPKAGMIFKLGTQGLGYYREKEVSTSAAALAAPKENNKSLRSTRAAARSDAAADDDAYAECFQDSFAGGAMMTTVDGESDDEEDGKKKKKKGEKEDQTKMDTSYGTKQKGGVQIDPKKKRMSEAQQWDKIETMIKKGQNKSIGELEASGRRKKDPPMPRELTATPAYF